MSDLKYYADEDARHPVLHKARCRPIEAEEAIKRLWLHFAGRNAVKYTHNGELKRSPPVTFTSGNRVSRASIHGVTLNTDSLNWLLVLHELAHSLDDWKCRTGGRSSVHRWHSKYHARWVDKLAAYVTELGWPSGSLAHELALRDEAARERMQSAAKPPERSQRIAHKEQLIARLERKVKALQSRIKSHRRSIAALKRAEERAKP